MCEFAYSNSLEAMMPYTFLAATFFEVIYSVYEYENSGVYSLNTDDMHRAFENKLSNLEMKVSRKDIVSDVEYNERVETAKQLDASIKDDLLIASNAVKNKLKGCFDEDNKPVLEEKNEEDAVDASFRWARYYQQAVIVISNKIGVELNASEKTMTLIIAKNSDVWKLVYKGYSSNIELHKAFLNGKHISNKDVDDYVSNPIAHFLCKIGRLFIWDAQLSMEELEDEKVSELMKEYKDEYKGNELEEFAQDPTIAFSDTIQ